MSTTTAEPDPSRAGRRVSAPDELHVRGNPDDAPGLRAAKLLLGPIAANAMTAKTYTKGLFGPTALNDAVGVLEASIKAAQAGQLGDAEALLVAQAMALNSIFNLLAMRAHGQDQLKNLDTFLRLALKAQNQSRMTLETLAAIKNPPVVFARQANIANGPQQVNNAASPPTSTHAAKIETTETKLLEARHGQRLDTRAARPASRVDPQLAPVGKLHGPKIR